MLLSLMYLVIRMLLRLLVPDGQGETAKDLEIDDGSGAGPASKTDSFKSHPKQVGFEVFGLFTGTTASVIEIYPHAAYRRLAAGSAPWNFHRPELEARLAVACRWSDQRA